MIRVISAALAIVMLSLPGVSVTAQQHDRPRVCRHYLCGGRAHRRHQPPRKQSGHRRKQVCAGGSTVVIGADDVLSRSKGFIAATPERELRAGANGTAHTWHRKILRQNDAARKTFSTLLYWPLTTISQTITAQTGTV